jgi:large subunit ribosomal protein L13
MKTYSIKGKDIKHNWQVVDASGQILGKLGTTVASMLMGKNKPTFSRNIDTGDFVVVINATKIKVTGKKLTDKMYYRSSMYPGGLKAISLQDMLKTHPERVIEHAVKGMLPQNSLGKAMLKKLKVYAGDSHPHQAQVGSSGSLEGGQS